MKSTGAFDLQEPKIQKEEILVVKDKYFNPKNVAIVTGASSGVGRATAIALGVNGLTVIGTDINEEGGKLTETQMAKVFAGIKPSLDRLGKIFHSFEDYISQMKQAPYLQPWNPFMDRYFQYEVEEVEGGVRSRVHPKHIEEEAQNLGKVDSTQFYQKVISPTLILRATKGMLTEDDLVLPEDVADRMVHEMPNAKRVDVEGVNHYTILFQPDEKRDQAILHFLKA